MRADAVKVKIDNAGRFPALGKGEFTYPNIAPAEQFCGGVFLHGAEAFLRTAKSGKCETLTLPQMYSGGVFQFSFQLTNEK